MEQIEIVGKRKPREKHYLKENGIIEAQLFDQDIHFLKNGIYEEIDNTLIKKNDIYDPLQQPPSPHHPHTGSLASH